jgi:hypothetical protein
MSRLSWFERKPRPNITEGILTDFGSISQYDVEDPDSLVCRLKDSYGEYRFVTGSRILITHRNGGSLSIEIFANRPLCNLYYGAKLPSIPGLYCGAKVRLSTLYTQISESDTRCKQELYVRGQWPEPKWVPVVDAEVTTIDPRMIGSRNALWKRALYAQHEATAARCARAIERISLGWMKARSKGLPWYGPDYPGFIEYQ